MSVEQREFDDEQVTPEPDEQPGRERIVGIVRGARCGASGCRDADIARMRRIARRMRHRPVRVG